MNRLRPPPGGITEYYETEVTVRIGVPKSRPVCAYCDFYRAERDLNRYYCPVTRQPILQVDRDVGLECPLRKEIKTWD